MCKGKGKFKGKFKGKSGVDGQLMAITDMPPGHPIGGPPGQPGFPGAQPPPLPPPPGPPGSTPLPSAVDGDFTKQWLQDMDDGGEGGRGKDVIELSESSKGISRPPVARESRHDAPVPDGEFKSLLQEAMEMGASSGAANAPQPPPLPQPDADSADDFTSQWLNAMDNWDDEAWDVANSNVAEEVPPPPPDEAPPPPGLQPQQPPSQPWGQEQQHSGLPALMPPPLQPPPSGNPAILDAQPPATTALPVPAVPPDLGTPPSQSGFAGGQAYPAPMPGQPPAIVVPPAICGSAAWPVPSPCQAFQTPLLGTAGFPSPGGPLNGPLGTIATGGAMGTPMLGTPLLSAPMPDPWAGPWTPAWAGATPGAMVGPPAW